LRQSWRIHALRLATLAALRIARAGPYPRRVASQAWRNTGQAALEHRLNPVVSRVANARGEINAHGAAKKEKADAMNVTLPQWCADIISSPPRSGEGFHNWLFRAARGLWRCGRDENDVREILENAAATCGRRVSAREIADAVRHSQTSAFQLARAQRQPWPVVNHEQREAVIATGFGLVDLWEISPVRFEDNAPHTEEIVDQLFPRNPLLCIGAATHDCHTARRKEWRGRLASLPLIVPTPMTAPTGRNQNGEVSNRCLENTGERRFLIVEFDTGTTDEHAALLFHLAQRAPLALAVFSGSKSLHGWFYCAGVAEEKVSRFFRCALTLGADRATWTRCQLVRTPDGTRAKGKRQTVYFFNPEVLK